MIAKNLIIFFIDIVSVPLNKIALPMLSYVSFPAGLLNTFVESLIVANYILPITLCMPLIVSSLIVMLYLCARALIHVAYNIVKLLPFI